MLGWSLELTELGIIKSKENKECWDALFEPLEGPDEDGALPLFNNLFSMVIEWLRWNGELVDDKTTFTEQCIDRFITDVMNGDNDLVQYIELLEKIVGLYIWRNS